MPWGKRPELTVSSKLSQNFPPQLQRPPLYRSTASLYILRQHGLLVTCSTCSSRGVRKGVTNININNRGILKGIMNTYIKSSLLHRGRLCNTTLSFDEKISSFKSLRKFFQPHLKFLTERFSRFVLCIQVLPM